MKLCIVTHKVVKGDGQGRVNYEVAKEAIYRGHQITLLASSIAPELEQSSQVNWICLPVKNLPTVFLKNIAFAQQAGKWLQKHHQELDLIKVNGAITSFPSDVNAVHFVHSSWLKSPVHIWQQRKDIYGFYHLFYSSLNSYWEKQAFAKTKRIVAVSEKVKQELSEIGVAPEKITVINNGVDLEEFIPRQIDRTLLGLPQNVPLALFVGDIRSPRKNLDTVLKALTKVPDLHFAIAGELKDSPYPKLAANLNLTQRTHFLGYRRDIAQLMQASDMFVFPSRYEACTLVLLEAIASGIPVITAKTTGGSEVITPECGILLKDTEDIAELAEALQKLLENPSLRKQMGQAGRTIAQEYSWKSKAESYLDLCEELVNQ